MGSITSPAPIHLAILEADEPLPSVMAVRGRFGAIFTSLLRAACESLDPPQMLESQLALSTHDVVAGDPATAYPDPETIDAVLITGSKHSAFEDQDWIVRLVAYTRRLLEGGRVRVVGVCFGHQIAARAIGAQVARSLRGWELAVTQLELTEEGKTVFMADTLVS
jgi:GMP synthase-like glutamine amidotransferase